MSEESIISEFILPNGIKILHKHRPGAIAHLALMVNTGMRDELDNENGLAHFVEHMLFKGTKKRKAYHVLSCLENVGGELNAYTTKEETCIHASFLKEHYNKAIELIADVAFNSTYPANEVEKEKEVIIDEINSYRDAPAEEIFDEFENNLYKGHEMGRNILGTTDLVSNYTRTDLCNFIKNNYSTDKMVVATIGDIPFAKFKNKIISHFGDYQQTSTECRRKKFEGLQKFTKIEERNNHLSHCIIGGIAYHIDSQQKMPMVLLNNILGGPGMNSRLNVQVRERAGLVYSIDSYLSTYPDTGMWNVYFGCDPHDVNRCLKLVKKELRKLAEKPLTASQLRAAQKQLKGQIGISCDNREGYALALGKTFAHYNVHRDVNNLYEEIDRLTPELLQEIAREVYAEDKLSTLIYK